jgi:hypothetical protein
LSVLKRSLAGHGRARQKKRKIGPGYRSPRACVPRTRTAKGAAKGRASSALSR